jgi:hypothetical protein
LGQQSISDGIATSGGIAIPESAELPIVEGAFIDIATAGHGIGASTSPAIATNARIRRMRVR